MNTSDSCERALTVDDVADDSGLQPQLRFHGIAQHPLPGGRAAPLTLQQQLSLPPACIPVGADSKAREQHPPAEMGQRV